MLGAKDDDFSRAYQTFETLASLTSPKTEFRSGFHRGDGDVIHYRCDHANEGEVSLRICILYRLYRF